MILADQVHISRRFQRSIRIDSDLRSQAALEGFICPKSSVEILMTMAKHTVETEQAAFTWTGPYGSGKSSLVVALSALLNGDQVRRDAAATAFPSSMTRVIQDAYPSGSKGWKILPIVGRKDDPARVIGEALDQSGWLTPKPRGNWDDSTLVNALAEVSALNQKNHGGLILFVDEMGKFLESAANQSTDVYFFQLLAEAANRSKRRLIVVGILHQAFEEYASRLSRQARDEWSKIQGRFVDLAVNVSGEEQVELISKAIESAHKPQTPSENALLVASMMRRDHRNSSEPLAKTLSACWPLHPIVAGLLGPISRRRFGQNQRSIFGFLNSAEPFGFRDFLQRSNTATIYSPSSLWNYLRTNLEPSILASPDGHRWALAAEALERCETTGGDEIHTELLKTIAVIDLFKERSGLVPTYEVLKSCFPGHSDQVLKKALVQLKSWSFIIFKKFLNGYAVFAGSDFDIDQAVDASLESLTDLDFQALRELASLQPILAKRHYHSTGSMRWFEVNMIAVRDLLQEVSNYRPSGGAIGQFVLAIPTQSESEDEIEAICREAARHSDKWDIITGSTARAQLIVAQARELLALEMVRRDRPELAGDSVARRELSARTASIQTQLEMELHRAFDSANWYIKGNSGAKSYRQAELNTLASRLADKRFHKSPQIHNELLNRQKPSGNAIAAQNELLRRMVLFERQARLGIEGFPAEGGLYASLLEASGLYRNSPEGWSFQLPDPDHSEYKLNPLWSAATELIRKHSDRSLTMEEIYSVWREAPYGLKEGLLPVLAVAFILSLKGSLAIYREGIFRSKFDDVDVQYLAKDPSMIQIRWMDLSDLTRDLLSGMADVVRHLDPQNSLKHLEPIDVARGLVAVFDALPNWTKRTARLSSNSLKIRDLFRRAKDPNQFLFNELPGAITGAPLTKAASIQSVVSNVGAALEEMQNAYAAMLSRLREIMLTELDVPNLAPQSIEELRSRAKNIRQIAGDFHLDAFINRISTFDGTESSFEPIASLATNKPPRDWVDPDVDKAALEIASYSQKFLRAETFARIQGRTETRESMAIILSRGGRPKPLMEEFAIGARDKGEVHNLVSQLRHTLKEAGIRKPNIILAALAEIVATCIEKQRSRKD